MHVPHITTSMLYSSQKGFLYWKFVIFDVSFLIRAGLFIHQGLALGLYTWPIYFYFFSYLMATFKAEKIYLFKEYCRTFQIPKKNVALVSCILCSITCMHKSADNGCIQYLDLGFHWKILTVLSQQKKKKVLKHIQVLFIQYVI